MPQYFFLLFGGVALASEEMNVSLISAPFCRFSFLLFGVFRRGSG